MKINVENPNAINKIKYYLTKNDLYTSWAYPCEFQETAFMILNDKLFIETIMKFYENMNNINENLMFEESLIAKTNFQKPFNSIRLHTEKERTKALNNINYYDYFAQYNWDRELY